MIPKFRAWDKTHKKLGLIDADMQDGYFQSVKIFDEDEDDWQESDRFVLMQSTGLKDKNDVEIFEGDVVKQEMLIPTSEIEEITGVVKMLEGAWTIVNDKKKIACNLWREGAEMEILGNIWEGGDQNN